MVHFLAASLIFSVLITAFNRGFFSFPSLAVLTSLLVLLAYIFFKKLKIDSLKLDNLILLPFLLAVVYSLFLFYSGGIYQTGNLSSLFLAFLPIVSFPLILTYLIPSETFRQKTILYRFLYLILLALALRILVIIASPKPIIDVFTILLEAPMKFLQGLNPYDTVYSAVYQNLKTDYFPYWPFAFLAELPFVYLFGDPRVLLMLADLGCALMIYFTGKKTISAQILALIYLFRPNSIFVIEQSWVTPLTLFLTILSFRLMEKKKILLSGLVLGMLISVQPYFLVLLPFLLFLTDNGQKLLASLLLVTPLTVIPFIIMNPFKFMDKTIFVYFKPLDQIPTIPVHLSLNFNTFFYILSGNDLPAGLMPVVLSGVLIFILYKLYLIKNSPLLKKKGDLLPPAVLGLTLYFYVFYSLFRQAFINYYYFTGGLLIYWTAIISAKNKLKSNL